MTAADMVLVGGGLVVLAKLLLDLATREIFYRRARRRRLRAQAVLAAVERAAAKDQALRAGSRGHNRA